MRQILLLILLFVAGQWFVKALRRAQSQSQSRQGGAQPHEAAGGAGASRARRARPAVLPEPMVRCAECGVHAPKSESVLVAGRTFCSEDHARRHAARTANHDRAA